MRTAAQPHCAAVFRNHQVAVEPNRTAPYLPTLYVIPARLSSHARRGFFSDSPTLQECRLAQNQAVCYNQYGRYGPCRQAAAAGGIFHSRRTEEWEVKSHV